MVKNMKLERQSRVRVIRNKRAAEMKMQWDKQKLVVKAAS